LVDRAPADQAQALTEVLARLPNCPVYEGVYRYAYLLARKAKNTAAITACEAAPNFTEHFSLNVHLLPPAVQTSEDVARVRAIWRTTAPLCDGESRCFCCTGATQPIC
jgi:hypothetical protein